mmetsp:Transcript_120486/g.292395  ORF Transcript_120486/g.292395 Transcript_120486/m.292395 type:complete len:241 (+) Transcript_120486:153-875(+)
MGLRRGVVVRVDLQRRCARAGGLLRRRHQRPGVHQERPHHVGPVAAAQHRGAVGQLDDAHEPAHRPPVRGVVPRRVGRDAGGHHLRRRELRGERRHGPGHQRVWLVGLRVRAAVRRRVGRRRVHALGDARVRGAAGAVGGGRGARAGRDVDPGAGPVGARRRGDADDGCEPAGDAVVQRVWVALRGAGGRGRGRGDVPALGVPGAGPPGRAVLPLVDHRVPRLQPRGVAGHRPVRRRRGA